MYRIMQRGDLDSGGYAAQVKLAFLFNGEARGRLESIMLARLNTAELQLSVQRERMGTASSFVLLAA